MTVTSCGIFDYAMLIFDYTCLAMENRYRCFIYTCCQRYWSCCSSLI